MSKSPLAKRLKEARKKKNLTQKKLGLKINVDEQSAGPRVTHYEKSRHAPDYSTLKDIAEALEVPVAYFYCENDLLAELICAINNLTEDKQKELLMNLKK